ncbi:MAG: proton-conducting transporter membrane subunit [Acidimicrobiales bacterium]
MSATLLLVALLVFAAGGIVDVVVGTGPQWARLTPFVAGIVGGGLVIAAGVRTALGPIVTVSLGSTLGVGESSLRFDPLAGMFLTLSGGLAVAISACLVSWARPVGRLPKRGTGAGYHLLLASVCVIFVAGDAFTFLFAWEALTVSFYALTAIRRRGGTEADARTSWVTFGMGKLSGAALLFGFLLLSGRAHSYDFTAWSHIPVGGIHDAGFALLVIGFGAKVGLVPLQVWLPIGYPAAPGPVRAAMAGLAVNVGFYGLWRFLGVLGSPPQWLVVLVLVAGGATALLGITFATVQPGLNRVIAYSSVENAGIILVGYGVALAGAATGNKAVVAVGLLAASLQILAHSVAKSLLFASSAFFESDYESDDLETLRGVAHRDRVCGAAFGIGAVTLAGLPPSIGFVSEWFILESLMQEFRVHSLTLRLGMAVGGALVALTVGVAALCFIRVLGIGVLGRRKEATGPASTSVDGGVFGRGGLGLLAISCFGLAAAAPWVVRFMSDGLAPVVPYGTTLGALRSPWVLQPVFAQFSILSPSWFFIAMPIGFVVVACSAFGFSRGRLFKVRRVPAWRSASPAVSGPDRYSAFGYSNVLRHVLSNVLGSRRSAVVSPGGHTHADHADGDHSHADHTHVEVEASVVEPVEAYLYRPARAVWLRMSNGARRLQSGRLDAYVGYMLIGVLILLGVVAIMR